MPAQLIIDLNKYGYFAIFLLIFLQETGVPNPIPNELVLLFSGYLTFTGILYLPWVILTATLADFIGTNILYFVFYFFGTYILQHKPRWLPVSQVTIHKLTRSISGGNIWMVCIGRLTPFIRGYTSVVCGLIHLRPKKFLPIALISAITWSAVYVSIGKLLGPYWNYVAENISHIKLFLLIILLSILIIIIVRYIIHKNH